MNQHLTDLPNIRELGMDLRHVAWFRVAGSLIAPFVCSGVYFYLMVHHLWPLAVVTLIYLNFITYASISHDLVHGSLGLPKFWNHLFLSLIELLTLHSGHAYQKAHLYHHQTFPQLEDIEGAAARFPFWDALFYGVLFQYRIWWWALTVNAKQRYWIGMEGFACLLLAGCGLLFYVKLPSLTLYILLMVIGSWVIPFFTSFLPHDAFQTDPLRQTRLFRGKVASILAMEHLYHLEHHLYPSIPHYNWAKLAKRLDPYFASKGIQPIKLWF